MNPGELGRPVEDTPPEPDDIILHSGLRVAVGKNQDGFVRLMFSRPIYFVDLSQRNAKLLRDKISELISPLIMP